MTQESEPWSIEASKVWENSFIFMLYPNHSFSQTWQEYFQPYVLSDDITKHGPSQTISGFLTPCYRMAGQLRKKVRRREDTGEAERERNWGVGLLIWVFARKTALKNLYLVWLKINKADSYLANEIHPMFLSCHSTYIKTNKHWNLVG